MKLPAGGPQRGTLDDKLPAGYASRPRTRPVGVCVAMVPRLQGNTVRQSVHTKWAKRLKWRDGRSAWLGDAKKTENWVGEK